MQEHSAFGISVPEMGWVPSPTYLLRRHRVLALIDRLERGRLLEIGCGAGGLLHDLASRGFTCEALETSADAREIAAYTTQNDFVRIHERPQTRWQSSFLCVVALEVLEHVENDGEAVRQWFDWLQRGGRLVVSVPANPKRWNASDVWAGHHRRYGRKDLRSALEAAGFRVDHIENYGFPLANFIEPIRAHYHARQMRAEEQRSAVDSRAANTARSGIERSAESRLYPWLAGPLGTLVLQGFSVLQRWTARRHWGPGLLALASRAH